MASPNDTVVLTGATITDPAGNDWYIHNGQVYENGVVDAGTNNVDAIALVGGNIWQQANPAGTPLWWAKTGGPGSYDGWTSGPGTNNSTGTPTSPLTTPSPDGTTITAGGSTPLVDSQGNLWWISGGQVVENGQPDAGTDNVTQMAYEGGYVWQEATPSWSSSPLWWAKTGGPGSYDGWTSGPGTDNANGTPTSPIPAGGPPTDLTWTGGGLDGLASNPANWAPTGVPLPSDSLFMNPGATINVAGDALAGDTLFVNGNTTGPSATDTLNLSGGNVTFNLDDGSPDGYPTTIINLADNTNWIGGFNAGPYGGGVSVQATGMATFSNTNSTIDNSAVVNANVTGNGSFSVNEAHNNNAKLEFMHGVSAGQTVSIGGYAAYGGDQYVQVDDPSNYQASNSLAFGELILKGVTADSYTFNNDLLSLSNGGQVVDTVNLALDTKAYYGPQNFGVSQVGSDIYVHANGASYTAGGTLLS